MLHLNKERYKNEQVMKLFTQAEFLLKHA